MSIPLHEQSELQPPGKKAPARFSSSLLLTMGTNLLLAVLALVTGSLVARILGPQGRGELAAIQIWAAFIALLAALGLPDAVVFFTSRFPDRGREYLLSAITLFLISSIPFIIGGYILLPRLLAAQPESIIGIARWYLIIFVLLQATQGMLLHPLRGRHEFFAWNLFRIGYMIGWLAVVLLLGLVGRTTVTYLALGFLLSLVIVSIPVAYYVLKRVPGNLEVNITLWRPMLSYGLPLMASVAPQTLNLRMDQLAMGMFLPPQDLGYYAIAVTWSTVAVPAVNGIGAVLFPRIARRETNEKKILILTSASSFNFTLSAAISLVIVIITPFVIPFLFGYNYRPAIPAALILMVASIPLNLSSTLEEGLRGLGNPKAVLWAESAGLIVTIISLGILLIRFSLIGAAIASLFGYTTTAIILLYLIHKITGESILSFFKPQFALWISVVKATLRASRKSGKIL